MKLFEKNISELVHYENNPRKNDAAIDKVAESIRQFGFKVPIVIDRENVIVAGHTRVLAAEQLGMKKVPCIIADDLTPEQVKAFRLADNKVSEFSSWDFDKLDAELAELGDTDIDMSAFGFEGMHQDTDADDFFDDKEEDSGSDAEPQGATGGTQVVCPHCGETFAI